MPTNYQRFTTAPKICPNKSMQQQPRHVVTYHLRSTAPWRPQKRFLTTLSARATELVTEFDKEHKVGEQPPTGYQSM